MNGIEVLIKELDPDYKRCSSCKRVLHKSKVNEWHSSDRTASYISCKDQWDCGSYKYRMDMAKNESQKHNQRA